VWPNFLNGRKYVFVSFISDDEGDFITASNNAGTAWWFYKNNTLLATGKTPEEVETKIWEKKHSIKDHQRIIKVLEICPPSEWETKRTKNILREAADAATKNSTKKSRLVTIAEIENVHIDPYQVDISLVRTKTKTPIYGIIVNMVTSKSWVINATLDPDQLITQLPNRLKDHPLNKTQVDEVLQTFFKVHYDPEDSVEAGEIVMLNLGGLPRVVPKSWKPEPTKKKRRFSSKLDRKN